MTALSSSNTSSHCPTRSFDVLIKPETEGKVSAIVLGLPEYRVTGSDRTAALAALQQLLTENLSQAEIVSIDVAVPQPENPWLKMAGRRYGRLNSIRRAKSSEILIYLEISSLSRTEFLPPYAS